VVDWTRTYLSHVFNWRILDAYRALRQKDSDRAVRSAQEARRCLALLEDLLSTRLDFSLQTQIDWVTKVPGINPDTAWLIKKHCVNDLYSANECYEQTHWYYRPRMDIYLTELEQRAKDGRTVIEWKEIQPRCAEIEKRWLDGDIAVPASERPRVTTRQAVMQAANWLVDQTGAASR
jgi:hypothetical protein